MGWFEVMCATNVIQARPAGAKDKGSFNLSSARAHGCTLIAIIVILVYANV